MVAMAGKGSIVLCLAALAALVSHTEAAVATGTPIDRVIGLLGKIEAQIEAEGKKEAAEYDKFACYCKEQADDTLYAIENSEEKIKVLKAQIAKLDAEIKDLNADIKDLKATIKKKEDAITKAVDKRKKENDAYVLVAEELADAIGAIEGAIKELKGSKEGMKNAKLNLLQDQLYEVLSATSPSEHQLRAVASLAQAPADPAKKHAYIYRSNDIIGTLETLLDQFKDKKKDANIEEKDKLFAFEEKKQSLENERDFAEKEKTEKETILSDKTDERAQAQKDQDAEQKAMDADQGFLDEITADCESKAQQWDQRSTVRSDELQAIGKAMGQLKSGVAANYGSNALAASFLQLRRARGSAAAVISRAAALISGEGTRLQSASLSGLALKLSMGGHFSKVVNMIKDLIKKLEDEAKAASSAKSDCDASMKKAVEKRDKNKLDSEDQAATIAMKTAEKNKLADDVNTLSDEIAKIQKSKLEATELRTEEKADNEVTIDEAKAGKKSVDAAIKVLNDFYGAQFLQESAEPAKNRDGETVKGTAPKLSYDGDYKGKQGASKGIIGILEVIASDFQRTIDNVGSDEKSSQTDFEAFEKKADSDIDDKRKLKGTKEDDIKKASDAITQAKDDMRDADKLMEAALEELEKVTAMCMTGEGTFAERKKQREEEIKALKGAMKLLEDWKE